MRRWSAALGAAIVAAATILLLRLTATGEKTAPSAAPPAPPGVAVVIDAERAPEAELPDLDDLRADPGAVAQAYRDAGLRVAADPTGRCLAVTAPAHISDEAMLGGDLPDYALAAGIAERMTSEQLAAREKGYLWATKLSKVQLAAARRVAQRHGLIDKQGRVTEAGTHLSVGIWQTWFLHLAMQQSGETICRRVGSPPYAPTEAAIAQPPLAGSVLWYTWPYARARWGEERVSVEAGTYSLGDVLTQLSRAGRAHVTAQQAVRHKRLAVVAADVPLRTLLWAIEAATAFEVSPEAASEPASILVTSEVSSNRFYHADINLLLPMPHVGYWSPGGSAIGRDMLSKLAEGPAQGDEHWMGWRFCDLPLLYRSWVAEQWQNTYTSERAEPLDPDHTLVLWTKGVLVSVNLQFPDGGGGGTEFPLSAL